MKKVLAVFFLLICGLVVLLATVDLEPYLAPNRSENAKNDLLPPESGTEKPPATNEIVQAAPDSTVSSPPEKTASQPEDNIQQELSERDQVAAPEEDLATGQGQMTPSTTKPDEIVEGTGLDQIPSSLIELEVSILPVGEYPFSILLDTFWDQETAQKALDYYQERGISAHWVKVNLGKDGIRYRLFAGIFSTVPEAQEFLDQNQLVGKLIKATYFSARVGVYTDKGQLANSFLKTSNTGVIPYILGTKKGDFYLYVGAFYTFIGATEQCRDLIEAGLSCEPVKRSTIPPQ